MQKYEKIQTNIKLLNELEEGKRSGEKEGWLTIDEVEAELNIKKR